MYSFFVVTSLIHKVEWNSNVNRGWLYVPRSDEDTSWKGHQLLLKNQCSRH